ASRHFYRDLLNINPEPTANDFAPSAKLGQFLLDEIDRNREPDPDVEPAARINRRIDTHHCPVQADQRSPGMARVDGRIGLNKGVIIAWDKAPFGTDNPGGNRMVEAEGVADRHHPLAHLDLIRIA